MNDTKTLDSSSPGGARAGHADVAALLRRCSGQTRPLRPEALRAVERLKAVCIEEAREHRERMACLLGSYSMPPPAAARWYPPILQAAQTA